MPVTLPAVPPVVTTGARVDGDSPVPRRRAEPPEGPVATLGAL